MLDIAKELEKTLHVHTQDLPWIPAGPGMEMRLIQARLKDEFFVTQIRAQPGCESGLHRHPTKLGIGGYTLKGAWGHDRQYLYRPGTYIFETPGVIHQFFNGPEKTEVLFFGDFAVEFINPETLEVKGEMSSEAMLKKFFEACEKKRVKPNYLT